MSRYRVAPLSATHLLCVLATRPVAEGESEIQKESYSSSFSLIRLAPQNILSSIEWSRPFLCFAREGGFVII